MGITYKVLCLNYFQADVAKEYRVTKHCISTIISRSKKNAKFIEELMSKREAKEAKREEIGDAIAVMTSKGQFIDTVASVKK